MSNTFTTDQIAKSETLDPNSIKRLHKLNLMCKLMEIQSNEPILTQKQISNQLGFSDSTTERYRNDRNMNSFYKKGHYKKRRSKEKTSTSTKELSKGITNKKSKNNVLKGGDPSNIYFSGKELIEQAVSQKDKWLIL